MAVTVMALLRHFSSLLHMLSAEISIILLQCVEINVKMTRKWFSCLKALAHLVPCSFHHSLDTAAFKTSDSGTDSNPSKIDTNALSMRMMFAV
jgi:hypothetical protein